MTEGQGSAVVTDSALRTALYTIRCLGRHGVRVTAAERATPLAENLGGLSRYVSRRAVLPDNRSDPDGYADALLALAGSHDVLVPIGMHSIEPVARRLGAFREKVKVALPPWPTVAQADSTRDLLDLAERLDVPVPQRFKLADYPSVGALASAVCFPAIVKTGVEAGLPPRDRYRVVLSAAQLVEAVGALRRITPDPIIQELIRGEGVGFEALYDFEGRLVASFCHRRLREYPLSGGPSTFCESCHLPVIVEYGRRILEHLQWVGLAMVEFKIDARTGTPMLMEINPRPWGSMELPIRAGVEFPWLLYQLARDGALGPQADYPDGVRLRFLINDLQAVAGLWRRTGSLAVRLSMAASLLDPRVKEGILKVRDPRPSWAYIRKGAARALRGQPAPFNP
jgi:predicted ATP-grasp superfamily ATP-dependent carboligase